jgi:iron complex transport system substrate-binding protein
VLSLEPVGFADVLSTIKTVGDHTDRVHAASRVISNLRTRVDRVALGAAGVPPRRVVCLEWMDPPWSAGHWVPDMVGLAGGIELLGVSHQPSRRVSWEALADAQPDVIVLAVCGFDLDRTMRELDRVPWPSLWNELEAVQAGQVYAVDGSAYFTRPGPRLVDGIEILAGIFSGRSETDRFQRVPTP